MKRSARIRTSSSTRNSGILIRIIRGIQQSKRFRLVLICSISAIVIAIALIIVLSNSSSGTKQASNIDPVETDAVITSTPSPIPTTTPTPDPTLKFGDNNEQVKLLQQRLIDLGYIELSEPTTKFGPATKQGVEYFQRQHNLNPTGIADPETLIYINSDEAQPYMLLQGTKGEDVNCLQRKLVDLGYLNKVTAYYGTDTEAAVKLFQKENDLKADGKTGEKTLDLIYSPDAKVSPTKRKELITEGNINEMISIAKKQIGKPYIGGREGPDAFDCSGLVYYCLHNAGSSRGRYNAQGYSAVKVWTQVDWNHLKRGDLMFFWSSAKGKIGHVAIYIGKVNGKNMIIDAMNGVQYHTCDTRWYKSTFKFGRRPWEIP